MQDALLRRGRPSDRIELSCCDAHPAWPHLLVNPRDRKRILFGVAFNGCWHTIFTCWKPNAVTRERRWRTFPIFLNYPCSDYRTCTHRGLAPIICIIGPTEPALRRLGLYCFRRWTGACRCV